MPAVITTTLVVRADREADALCVVLFGELDLEGAEPLGQVLRRAISRHERVVVDLSGLDFIDSHGVQALIEADVGARLEGCRLELLRGPRAVHRVFRLCRVAAHLPFAD